MSDNMHKEKRRYIRVKTFLDVMLKVYSHDWQKVTDRISGVVLDISKDSFFVKTDRLPLVGDRISFLIYSKKRKIQYTIKGLASQIRKEGVVVMATEVDPPEMVVNDFRSEEEK